jgi:hypothetical protein
VQVWPLLRFVLSLEQVADGAEAVGEAFHHAVSDRTSPFLAQAAAWFVTAVEFPFPAMLTPMCSAATLVPVEQLELGLTKRSFR